MRWRGYAKAREKNVKDFFYSRHGRILESLTMLVFLVVTSEIKDCNNCKNCRILINVYYYFNNTCIFRYIARKRIEYIFNFEKYIYNLQHIFIQHIFIVTKIRN